MVQKTKYATRLSFSKQKRFRTPIPKSTAGSTLEGAGTAGKGRLDSGLRIGRPVLANKEAA